MVSSGTPCDSRYQVATSAPKVSSDTSTTSIYPASSFFERLSCSEMTISQRMDFTPRSLMLV